MIPITSKRVLLAAFALIFLFFLIPVPLRAAEEIRLEGVIVDAQNPQKSVAVLNGNLLKPGDEIENFKVGEVFSDSVKLIDESGKEKVILLSSGKKQTASLEPLSEKEGSQASVRSENLLNELFSSPGKLIGRFMEIRGLRDLAIVNNACVTYYNQKKVFPASLSELIQANLLAGAYESGIKGKYRIYLVRPPEPAQFGVHADPSDPNLKYFYVGTDAIIRESIGKPAGPTDKPHEY